MDITFANLINPRSREQWRTLLMTELEAVGFAVSLAPSGDNRRNLVEFFAAGLARIDGTVAKIARGAFLDTATNEWLKLRVKANYDIDAKKATKTRGTVRLTCAATAGPYTIAAGQVWVGRAANGALAARRYQNTTGGHLASGGTLNVTVVAENAGLAYNLGVGDITNLFSGLSGVSVSNPAVGLTGTWITTPGTDDEGDKPLRQRARDRWPTLGRGATDSAYRYVATTASPEVTKAEVISGFGDGTLTVYLASESGGVSDGAVTTVQAALDAFKPVLDRPTARSATTATVAVTGTVYVRATQLAAVQAAVERERLVMQAELGIGDPVDLAELNAVLRRPRDANGQVVPGVTDVDLTSPTGDVEPPPPRRTHILVIDLSGLIWSTV